MINRPISKRRKPVKRNLLSISLAVAVMLLTQIAAPARMSAGASATYSASLSPQHDVTDSMMAHRRAIARVTYSAAFSIFNNTGITIPYQIRWGNQPWQNYRLGNGQGLTHYYPLGDNPRGLAPIPFIRFDRIADGGHVTDQIFRMEFYAVRNDGYGVRPKPYEFRYSANGRVLHIFAIE
jgi:hypothetical protein